MAKIVLCYPAWTGEAGLFGWFAKRNSRWPPLNLALLGAVAEKAGHEAVIFDAEVMGWDKGKLVQEIIKSKPDIVGLTCYSPFFHLSADVAESVKKLDSSIPVIVGGPHITIMKEKALLPQFDYAFMGEAERSLPEFLDKFSGTRDFGKIRGILFRSAGEIVNTGESNWIAAPVKTKAATLGRHYPLDEFPFPARHLLPMDSYKLGTLHGRKHFTSIQSMRGCFYRCIFCASDVLNTTRVILRSPKSIIEEIKQVIGRWSQITHFFFVDDILTFFEPHIREICDRISAEGLRITFEGGTRANAVNDGLIEHMARAGLIRLSFGLETIDPAMRTTMQKKVPLRAYVESNRICAKYGVEALNSLMIGLPGETRETIRTTVEWVRSQRDISQANIAIAIPYPGTEFGDMAINETHGVQLVDQDFSRFLRYGNAVTRVGDIEPQELVEWQNWAFVRIYSAPWRWLPVLRKHGVVGFLMQALRVFRLWRNWLLRNWRPLGPVMRHPKEI